MGERGVSILWPMPRKGMPWDGRANNPIDETITYQTWRYYKRVYQGRHGPPTINELRERSVDGS